ncbi:Ger(x)C family spore germination C-terminal domain-containing protein [Paenibacillus glycanilyticus]|uniref:Ger(x)C family spore germination protein n=1 Tax=Paenibacillus glycanilyticus TaxID=126569 RepID=UPI00203E2FD5|nr:Ger(x)C family spore germination protein [Paenibacillus glycanilyticus]MCM3628559.1 Ger(x)C family spore germination C-terminal domain-containing protein [Paenibacillus glycanilyticus]
MNRMLSLLLALMLLAVLPGCDYRILERIGYTYAASYDTAPGNQVEIGISIPRADPTVKLQRELHSAIGKSSKDARVKFSNETDLLLVNGQIRVLLYSEDLARKDLANEINSILRDTSISPLVRISLVNGNAKDLLFKNYKQHLSTDKYINRLLEKSSVNNRIPKTTLYEFERDYYEDGVDPVAPILKEEDEDITLDGIGLFRGYQYIAKIPNKDALLFSILRGRIKKGDMALDLAEHENGSAEEYIMFTSVISNRKMHVKHRSGEPIHVTLEANFKGSVHEYIGNLKLSKDADRHQVEKRVSELLTSRANRLVKQLQRYNVDSLGIGIHVRNSMSHKEWKALDWSKEYPRVKVDCQLKFKAKDYGKIR